MQKIYYIIFAIIAVFVLISIWYFVLNIYEVKFEVEKSADEPADYLIKIIPLNGFGNEINFREVNYSIDIIEGERFVEKIIEEKNSLQIKLTESSKIKLSIKTEYSLFESIIEIPTKSEER